MFLCTQEKDHHGNERRQITVNVSVVATSAAFGCTPSPVDLSSTFSQLINVTLLHFINYLLLNCLFAF